MNNNSSSTSLKKIKINLEYLGKSIGIEIEPYKTISQLKEKTRKIFFIINLEFKLIHSNKDLTPFDSITIGEYFKSKSKIHIKVIQLSNVNYSKEINSGQSRTEKSPNSNDVRSSYFANLNNSTEKIKINENENNFNLNNEDINNTDLNTLNNSNTNLDLLADTNVNISSKLKSKTLVRNKENNKANLNRSEGVVLNTNMNNNDANKASNNAKNLCECNSNLVKTYYCRNDNSFICRNCRMEDKHKLHNALHIDINNIEDSIKLYAITLQADISLDRKASRGYFQNFQSQKFVEPSSRKEMIIRKLDEIERKQEEILQKLPKFDPQNIDNLISEFDRKSSSTNEELEEVLNEMHNNFTKKKNKVNIDNAVEYFSKINAREKDLEGLSNDLKDYKINFKVQKKIDELYKILENALDDVLKNQTFSIENFKGDKKHSINNTQNSKDYSNLFNESFLSVEMINSMKNNLKNPKQKDFNLNNSLVGNSNINRNNESVSPLKAKEDRNFSSNNISNLNAKSLKLNKVNLKNKNFANQNHKINIEAIDKINEEMTEKRNKE